jgi:hypothetical protein
VGVRADLGEGKDDAAISSDIDENAPFSISGGPGDDDLRASLDGQPTKLDGGPGDDYLQGGPGTDHLIGGDGNDDMSGEGGADNLEAGAGDDTLSGDGIKDPAADVLDGGPGFDEIGQDWQDPSYDAPSVPTFVTLAGGADDGRAGEGDDLRNVEKIVATDETRLIGSDADEHLELFQSLGSAELIGNGGDDVLRGADGTDTLDGGAGNDDLDGGFNDDVITGGPGSDRIAGDRRGGDCGPLWCKYPYGNDTIEARDGERDTIMCGFGEDVVNADAADVVDADCETVNRGGAPTPAPGPDNGPQNGPGPQQTGGLVVGASATKRAIRVKVTTPAAGRIAATAKAKGRKAAKGSRKVAAAGTHGVTLRFAKRARRKLRAGTRLTISIRFTPTQGAAMTRRVGVTLKR